MISEIAGVATAVGVLLAVGGLLAQFRVRKHAIAQMYLSRYWEIYDLEHGSGAPLHLPLPSLRRRNVGRETYLRFCEDQYDVARLGWIDAQTWDVWHRGITGEVRERELQGFKQRDELDHLVGCIIDGPSGHLSWWCPAIVNSSRRRRFQWWLDRRLFGVPRD